MLKNSNKKHSVINLTFCFIYIFILTSCITLTSDLFAETTHSEQNQKQIDIFFRDVRMDHVEAVKSALYEGLSPNVIDLQGNPALLVAIAEKSLKTAKLLIDIPSIDLNKSNVANETAVMLASLGGYEDLVKDLIDKYDVELNKPGWTALHYAAINGRVSLIQYLLDHHAYIDALSPNGTTPLMLAARAGHIQAVKLLLDRGAEMSLKNAVGMTVIEFAESGNQSEIADGLKSRWLKVFGAPYRN
jgi:ankyrin repeat protein